MKYIYVAYKQSDMVEGRGSMIVDSFWDSEESANIYIDSKLGVMGRKPKSGKWSTETYGDWNVKKKPVFSDAEDLETMKKEKILANIRNKLNKEELKYIKDL